MRKHNLTDSETLTLFWEAPTNALFDQNIIATVLGCSPASLERARWAGFGGPPFKRIGSRSIRYEKKSVLDWLNEAPTKNSTLRESA